MSLVFLDITACTSGQTPASPQVQTLPAAEGTAPIPAEETPPETPKAKETPPTATPVPPTTTPTVSPLETLLPALGDPDRDVRVSAVESLGELGAAAKEAVPDLVEVMLQDRDWSVRFAAAEALGKMQAEAAPALSQVLDELPPKHLEDLVSRARLRVDHDHAVNQDGIRPQLHNELTPGSWAW